MKLKMPSTLNLNSNWGLKTTIWVTAERRVVAERRVQNFNVNESYREILHHDLMMHSQYNHTGTPRPFTLSEYVSGRVD